MTNVKKIVAVGAMVLLVGATSLTALASSNYTTPAQAVAGITGQSVEEVITEKTQTGKTYGTIADDAGKLAEFKTEMLEVKKDILAKKVAAGTLTQQQADEILAAIEENQANCDGTGSARIGQGLGAGFGCGNGQGLGKAAGQGMGLGKGNGRVQ